MAEQKKAKTRLTYGPGDMYYKKKKIGSLIKAGGAWHVSFYKGLPGLSFHGSTNTEKEARDLAEIELEKYLTAKKVEAI